MWRVWGKAVLGLECGFAVVFGVGVEREDLEMNRAVTSKEELLEAAKRIALNEGIDKLSIRRLAGECGVSVGVIYNYYPGKADLVLGVVEDFWRRVFHRDPVCQNPAQGFVEFFVETYRNAARNLALFRSALLWQLDGLSDSEKERGRQVEEAYFLHMKKGLLEVLERDGQIGERVWSEDFTKEGFVEFVFANMMAMLRAGVDCEFFREVLWRLLYENKEDK